MTSPKLLLTVAVALAALAWAPPAGAVTIDFRSDAFAGADGAASFASEADGISLTYLPLPTPDARLYWDGTDGFGVRYAYETDEIEGAESFRIDFSEAVYLETVWVTDLFDENGYLERGSYELDGGSPVEFTALSGQGSGTNGERTLAIGAWTSSIAFRAPGRLDGQGHEFSVAGIRIRDRVQPMPEPAAMVLFAVGGLLAGGALRRAGAGSAR
jgi:hypothetical protein